MLEMDSVTSIDTVKPESFIAFTILDKIIDRLGFTTKEIEFRAGYDNRNNRNSVVPFLTAIQTDYFFKQNDLVLLKRENCQLAVDPHFKRLRELNFKTVKTVFPDCHRFNRILENIEIDHLDVVYHTEFHFEFFLVEERNWDKVMLAFEILRDFRVSERRMLNDFLTLYKRLVV